MKGLRVGRLLRTLRHLRLRQIRAQIGHVFTGGVQPIPWRNEAPRLSTTHVGVDFLPSPPHARFDGWNRIELIGREVRFRDGIDWGIASQGPLWTFHLNQFDYARDPALTPEVRWRLIHDWIERCDRGAGWSQHPISLRLLTWGKLLLTPGALKLDPGSEALVRASMASQAETLSRNLEVRLQANHLFSNILGVVYAGLLFEGPDADRWLAHEALLREELDEQILPDGAHYERSPMYHGLLFENVLDLLNLARAASHRAPPALLHALEDAAARMWSAHRVWRHPDGEIALFGDSAFDIAHAPELLDDYAAALGIEAREPARRGVLDSAGFVRIECGSFTLIATASEPMPSYQPGHAHCDALSFELSVKDERVVTDTGVAEYIPGPLRRWSRATAAHATIEVEGEEQAEVWAAHRIGGRPSVRIAHVEPDRELAASCAGWRTPRLAHERRIRAEGGSIEIEDRVQGGGANVRLFLPFAPGLEPRLREQRSSRDDDVLDHGRVGGDHEVVADLDCGLQLRVELPTGVAWRLESALCFPRFGASVDRSLLVGTASGFSEGLWRFSLRRPRSTRRAVRSRGRR